MNLLEPVNLESLEVRRTHVNPSPKLDNCLAAELIVLFLM